MDPDPPQVPESETIEGKRKASTTLTRCCCSLLLFLVVSFFLAFFFGLVSIAIGDFTANAPVSVPTLCRIVSSSVDIKSSKICELGLLNYKAKNVLYPQSKGKKRFRCHDDYYWASVFEVEYKEYFSGQVLLGMAEAPKEALPRDCRPSFGTAWLTKSKFKVNETYNCRYTLGSRKADIYPDNLFNCHAKDPSVVELVKRFCILLMRSSIFDKGTSSIKFAYLSAGAVLGMVFGICSTALLKTLQFVVLALSKRWDARKIEIRAFAIRFRRACILVVYFSAVGWLMLEYGKIFGFKQLSSLGHKLKEITM